MNMKLFLLTILSTQALFGAAASAAEAPRGFSATILYRALRAVGSVFCKATPTADRGPRGAALARQKRMVKDVLNEEGIEPDLRLAEERLVCKRITDIVPREFTQFSRLKALNLFGNLITNIPKEAFVGLSNLEHLYLDSNKITNISEGVFAGLVKLRMLSLSNNKITNISEGAFAGLVKLKALRLSYNKITNILEGTFAGLVKLEMLSLSNNKITNILEGAFAELFNLEYLYLDFNKIKNVLEGTFVGLEKLKKLKLCSNPIEDVAPYAFHDIDRNVEIIIRSFHFLNEDAIPLKGIRRIKKILYCKKHNLSKVDHPCKIKDINPRDPGVYSGSKSVNREQFLIKYINEYMERHPELYGEPFNMYGVALCKGTPGW